MKLKRISPEQERVLRLIRDSRLGMLEWPRFPEHRVRVATLTRLDEMGLASTSGFLDCDGIAYASIELKGHAYLDALDALTGGAP